MCNCITEIKEALKEADPTIGAIDVECDNVFDMDPETYKRIGEAKTGQPIKVYHQGKTKKGNPKHTTRKSFLAHNFCPFCGEKYNPVKA